MNKQRRSHARPWTGIFGLFGFFGFTYFISHQIPFLTFFGFFSFFSYYWWGKMAGEMEDERLRENKQKASSFALSLSIAILFAGTVLIGNFFTDQIERAYALTVLLIALTFAVAINLSAYLTYRYDRGE